MTSIDLDCKTVYVHGGIPGEDGARWTVSHRMLQAHIHVAHAAIARTAWADDYLDRRSALVASKGGGDNILARWKALSRSIASPCLSLLETLAPMDKTTPWTLADYCLATTVSLRIVRASSVSDGGGGVRAELVSGRHPMPACSTSPMPTQALHHLPAMLLRFPASKLLVENEEEKTLRLAPPCRVWAADNDVLPLFFKPCLRDRETEFAREVDMLARIGVARLHEQQINTACMAGVVTTEDGAAVLGVVLLWTRGAARLAAETAVARVEMHGQWREEVRGIIGVLHERGIVWGDLNPHNILIDDRLAPWVVDFGGECNLEFVDDENRETATGDWQGFHSAFDYWLPARVAASSSSGR
jgi:hypothetical protein